MYEFRFESPAYLFLLVALLLLAFLLYKTREYGRKKLEAFATHKSLERLLKGGNGENTYSRRLAFWIGLSLAILALARPQANPEFEERESSSLDILVLLDVSRSMDAEDAPPSRLKKAKRTINVLMDQLNGDRVGVIAFAGTALLVSPLTNDYEMIRTFLQGVDSSMIQNQGTNIDGALQLAKRAMERGAQNSAETGSNVFLVLSDGEDHFEVTERTAAEIRKKGGTIYAIAFGTERGAPIPVRNERGELAGYKRDASGNTVLSTVNARSLQAIAAAGGGQFYFSTIDETEIVDFVKRVQGMQREGGAIVRTKTYQEYFYPMLVLAAISLIFSFANFRNLWRRKGRLFLIPLTFLSMGPEVHAASILHDKERRTFEESVELAAKGKPEESVNRLKPLLAENPDSGPLNYDVGTFLLNAKKYQDGREHLERAKKVPETRWKAAYNIAGSYALEGKRDEARLAYSELIGELVEKNSRTSEEEEILDRSRIALQQLQEDPKQNQSGGSENKEQDEKNSQKKQDQENKSGSGDKKQDSKDQNQESNEQENKGEEKQEGEKNEKEGEPQNQGEEKQQNPQNVPSSGRKPFRERDNMSEQDAKRILEALKQQESGLQKKFLRGKEKDAKESEHNSKDW